MTKDQMEAMDLARRLWHRQCGKDGLPCPTQGECEAFNLGFKAASETGPIKVTKEILDAVEAHYKAKFAETEGDAAYYRWERF